jgi:acetolactate synthase-1/2/3 large subunit
VPLITISGDIPSYMYGRHPHQEVNLHADADQTAIFRPFVKRAWHAHRVQDLPRFTERAFWTAISGRPGAVLLNVPMDLFSRPVPTGPCHGVPPGC